jgi:hypothetical protein
LALWLEKLIVFERIFDEDLEPLEGIFVGRLQDPLLFEFGA